MTRMEVEEGLTVVVDATNRMNRRVLDFKPVTINGPVTRNRARVLWTDGRLMIFSDEDDFMVFEDVPKPERRSDRRTWTTTVTLHNETEEEHSQQVTWAITGCNCGFALGRISARRLMNTVQQTLAAQTKETADE